MIKSMRIKIIVITMVALMILLSAIFISTNISMRKFALQGIDGYLMNIIETKGYLNGPEHNKVPVNGPPNNVPQILGASMTVYQDGSIQEVLFNDTDLFYDDLEDYALEIVKSDKGDGAISNYRYKTLFENGVYIIALANSSTHNNMLSQLVYVSIGVGVLAIIVLFNLTVYLSYYITKPVEESMEKQKRFISDSSHELKTPLSIISANLDLLEMEVGSNQRITAIGEGLKRMNMLIHELLLLARTEEQSLTLLPFNLSDVIESTVLPLEVIAFEQGNSIETYIEAEVMMTGNEESIRKMIGALMENAIKYSDNHTPVKIKLSTKGDTKIIEVYNEGIGVTKDQLNKLFDKFYRVDDSRHRETGGHGLGLSIVKNIVDMHKGKITVLSEPDEFIEFRIVFGK